MMKAYLDATSSSYEGEDIKIRYSIYDKQELLQRDTILLDYQKPAVVGHIALLTLLRVLKDYPGKEITIYINDPALNEFVRGTSTTRNKDVLKIGRETRKELNKYENVKVADTHGDRSLLAEWNEALSF